jgi:hypothetical protein
VNGGEFAFLLCLKKLMIELFGRMNYLIIL